MVWLGATQRNATQEVDPKLGEEIKRLQLDSSDSRMVDAFADACNAVVKAVFDLRECMDGE